MGFSFQWRGVLRRLPAVLVAVMLLAAPPAALIAEPAAGPAAQADAPGGPVEPAVPLREQVAARLVLVPVTVTDGRRRPVLDLGPRDFLLRVDGRPVPLASFDPPLVQAPGTDTAHAGGPEEPGQEQEPPGRAQGKAPRDAAAARPGRPSHVAFVVDMDLTRPGYISSGILALKEALAAGLPERTQAGLFVLTHGTILQILPFTGDVSALLAEVEKLPGRLDLMDTWIVEEHDRQQEIDDHIRTVFASLTLATLAEEEEQSPELRQYRDAYRSRFDSPEEIESNLQAGRLPQVEAAVRSFSHDQAARVRRALTALASLAAGMERLRGRRAVVLITEGLREQAGMNYTRGFSALADETVSLRADFQALTRVYHAAGITLSPVSLAGLFYPGARDPDALGEALSSLQFLARGTGGQKPVALSDFSGEIAGAVELPRATYVLGFEPVARDGPGTVHRIQVQVLRPRMEVSARAAYVEQEDPLNASLTMTGATILPELYRDLSLQVRAHRLPSASGEELLLQLELPLDAVTLTATGAGRRGTLMVAGLLRDAAGRSQVLFRSPYDLFMEAEAIHRLMVQEGGPLALDGATEVVAVLWDRGSGRMGTVVLPLPPPREDPGQVRVSRPVLLTQATGVYLLTPSGRPGLGIGDAGTLFLPGDPAVTQGGARLAMARVAGLPAGASVRFCLDDHQAGCVAARLTRPAHAPPSPPGAPPEGAPAVLDAWVVLDAISAAAAENLRIEILDPAGEPLAATGN